jgi:hypothetical protein
MSIVQRFDRQIRALEELQSRFLERDVLQELEMWLETQKELTHSLDFDAGGVTLCVSGTGTDLSYVWAELRHRGWHLARHTKRPKAGDAAWSGFFRRLTDEELEDPDLVFLCFSSTVCKRVKVGTRIITEDVYKTVCADDAKVEGAVLTPTFDPPPSYSGDSQGSVFDLPTPGHDGSGPAYEPTLLNTLPPLSEIVSITLPTSTAPDKPADFEDDIPF